MKRVYSKTIGTADHGGSAVTLLCPRCGSLHLHHHEVTMYERREDAPDCTVTTIGEGKLSREDRPNDLDNPSARRGGVAIQFDCEQCGDGIALTFAQHKGQTEICWAFAAT